MRRPSKLSTSSSAGRTNAERSSPPTAERVRRARPGAALQTSVESSGGPAVTVSEPSGRERERRDDAVRQALDALAVEPHLARAAAVDDPGAARARRVEGDDLDVGVVGRQELGLRALAQEREARRTRRRRRRRRARSRRAAGAAESYETSPSCGVRWVSAPLSGSTRKRSWSNGVFARCTRMPCSDQSVTCDQPPGCASSRRPPPSSADDGDVEIDAVAAGVGERDTRAVGRERARDVDGGRIVRQRQLGAAVGVDREQRVALVAAGVARDHPALLARRGQGGRDRARFRT